jgi:8-oxo-dGTP diphosphatase
MTRVMNRSETLSKSSREYPSRPLVGVGALIVEANRIVLVRRGSPPSKGEWSIPGGLIRVGETLRDAVVRESFEETGLSVEPGELVELVERIVPDDQGRFRYHYVIADFLCRVSGGGLRAGSDAPDAKWVPREQLEAMGLADITLKVVWAAFERSRV